MIDEDFECEVCKQQVNALGYTARNHCSHCLSSKHLDNNPGDRASICHGTLTPIAIESGKKQNYKIVYLCKSCGVIKKNKMARDDNMELVIQIMSKPQKYK